MLTFEEMAQKMGKRLTRARQRPFSSTQDRPKNFPTDHDILWIAAHPLGEIAGYVAWFEQRNSLKA